MSYQALYRSWRPNTFSEIYGQDAIVRTLRRQVMTGHIAHAYLFCGTRGTGKTTSAKVLARAINCLNPHDGDPCGECDVCRQLLEESCMDVVEIDAASNNGVDEIRDLREKVKYPPAVTRYKVYIIDEVHMLSTGAFNALLKTLEEPPAHAVFILATTEPQRLPATILSRCQRYDFHRISMDVIISRLTQVLDGIGRTASRDALQEIARAAEGAMRDALSLLDVCLSYTDGEVSAQLAREVLGTAGRAAMFDFTDALIDADAGRALQQIDQVMRLGSDPQVFIRDASAHLRAILLAGALGGRLEELLEITPEDAERFRAQAARTSPDAVSRMLELFMRAEPDTRWASRPRTVLELAAVRACRPEKEPDASVDERLSRVEKLIESGAAARPAAQPAAPKAAAQKPDKARNQPAKSPAEPPIPAEAPPQPYIDAIESLKQTWPSMTRMLKNMRFIHFDGSEVTVMFPKDAFMQLRILEKNKKGEIEAALSEAFGQPITVRMLLEGDSAQKSGIDPQVRTALNQAFEVFGRENVSVEE